MFRILCRCADQAPSTDAPTWRGRANRLFLVRLARPGPDPDLRAGQDRPTCFGDSIACSRG